MATYFVCSGAAGTNSGASWVNAHTSIPGLMTAQAVAGGDIIYVHKTHNYSASGAITWTLPETGSGQVFIYCVDGGDAAFTSAGASMGTTVGNLSTGASESTNGSFTFTVNGDFFCHGIQLKAGSGGSQLAADIALASSGLSHLVFQACTFWSDSTNNSARPTFGTSAGTSQNSALFKDCTWKFTATGQAIDVSSGVWEMEDCTIAGAAVPTTLIAIMGNSRGYLCCHGCDFSASTNVISQSAQCAFICHFTNCTIDTPTTGTHGGAGGMRCEFQACAAVDGTNGANILSYYYEDWAGKVQDDQTVYVTSSPAQGTQDDGTATSYSLKMTPSSIATPSWPLYTPWIYQKVPATGSKTITMLAADTEAAALKDRELFLEVEYMGGAAPANSPQTALEGTWPLSGVYADFTTAGSNLTDTNVAWTGVAENSTYTLSKTVTLDEQGYVRCRVGVGKQTTNPVYVDPKITVS